MAAESVRNKTEAPIVVSVTPMQDIVAVLCWVISPASIMHSGHINMRPTTKTNRKLLHMFQTDSWFAASMWICR